jgi:membrane protease YdiL (CAAX protease family)
MATLFSLSVALAVFLLVRKVDGVGYLAGWRRGWAFFVLASFVVCACVVIPLGTAIHFIQFAPRWSEWRTIPLVSLGILVFTAWPEEFLWTASFLFGCSHLPNGRFPNWKYAILASIAGLFYGWTWKKSRSIFASALVHTSVNVTWHFLFKTL